MHNLIYLLPTQKEQHLFPLHWSAEQMDAKMLDVMTVDRLVGYWVDLRAELSVDQMVEK